MDTRTSRNIELWTPLGSLPSRADYVYTCTFVDSFTLNFDRPTPTDVIGVDRQKTGRGVGRPVESVVRHPARSRLDALNRTQDLWVGVVRERHLGVLREGSPRCFPVSIFRLSRDGRPSDSPAHGVSFEKCEGVEPLLTACTWAFGLFWRRQFRDPHLCFSVCALVLFSRHLTCARATAAGKRGRGSAPRARLKRQHAS